MLRVPFPNENICSTSHILELLEEGLLDYFFFWSLLFSHLPLFISPTPCFYRHAECHLTHPPLTMPWTGLDMPVLNTPGLNLRSSAWLCCHTEVTVLTLADRACLNLLFRSCMLGDFGRGIREVLLLSGVLVVCCLLTSLQRTWKALKTSL